MKAILQKVPEFIDSSFAVQEFRSPYFSTPWHFHPEYELVLVLKSEGKRFVGDKITDFRSGDLVLLGSNIPHWYRNDACYYENVPELEAASLVIQFTEDFIGKEFFQTPETVGIQLMLQKAAKGLELHGSLAEKITKMMLEIKEMKGMDKLIHLLSLLNTIANSREYTVLSDEVGSGSINVSDPKRINRIYEYVMKHFQEPISIEEASGLINMCPSAFCRYFKKRTRKTFTLFLNEIRIGHACKLLIEEDLSVTEICYQSGFNNISYFNRQFKAIKNITPQLFRQEYFRKMNVS
jgi:AraC-like DNA-binding protein